MSYVFTSSQFIDKLKWLVNDVPNVYYSGPQWSRLNNYGQWQFDCVLSIKSILWGFRADPNVLRGGTDYCSNGVPDFTCDGGLNECADVSQDFSSIVAGEYLCMKGLRDAKGNPISHSGIYLGNGKVFEDTAGWGKWKAIISDIDKYGNRSLNGVTNLRWTYHGKLNCIDYSNTPIPPIPPVPTYKYKIGDRVVINGRLYGNADGGMAGQVVSNRVTNITRIASGKPYPYNTTGDLGWMEESSISPYVEPIPSELKVGDIVKIIATGNGSSYGDSNVAYGIGWTKRILRIYEGRPYPYQVGDEKSTIGFYKKSALEKK